MLDKRKIRLMIKMASYEKQGAEEDLKISSYYKKDYVSMNVWATAIWFTIGYAIVAALIAFCTLEQILEKLTILKLLLLMGTAVGGYLILLILYCTGARMFYKRKHNLAKQHVKKYYRDLSRLEKINKDTAVRVGIMCVRTDQFQYRIYESIILYSLYSWSCCCYGLSSGRDAGTCSSPACSGTSVCAVFAGSGIMSGNFSGDVYFLCKIYT